MLSLLTFTAILVGCTTPAAVDIPLDSDADGLLDTEEVDLGTDPTNPDSDGDTYEDGYELTSYTDPTDASDHPYAGGWEIGACRHDLTGTGNNVGNIAYQFELVDQHDEVVRLHDFCDREIIIISGAMS